MAEMAAEHAAARAQAVARQARRACAPMSVTEGVVTNAG